MTNSDCLIEVTNTALKEFYNKLDSDKIKINWNKNPIKMSEFLSFLTIDVTRSQDHLGSSTGWTQLRNDERGLIIKGGAVNGIEYLDSIEYGVKLSNPYNNYVNPFYLFEIMNEDGRKFFFNYYSIDIEEIVKNKKDEISSLNNQVADTKKKLKIISGHLNEMGYKKYYNSKA